MLTQIQNDNNTDQVTMVSLELVDYINDSRKFDEKPVQLRHADFMAKVPKVLGVETSEKFRSSYLAGNGEQRPCYRFPKREACLMAMSYSYELQAQVFDRMTAMEQHIAAQNLPSYAIATKAEIGSRREATAMSTASKYKRKAEKLEALMDESQSFATLKKVQSLTGGTYDTYALRRHSKANGLEIQKAEDANYGSVNSYHKDAWLAVYNINLSSIGGAA